MDMSIQQALKWAETQMTMAQIEDAKIDAWRLMSFVTGFTRTDYYMNMGLQMQSALFKEYQKLIEMRCCHIPLQHLTKEQTFMGLSFLVNEHVLIPRQETELLVLKTESFIASLLQQKVAANIRILDLCCGSGCIIMALKKRHPDIDAFAADLSIDALTVARENAKRLGVDVTFYHSDLFADIQEQKFDIIVSNPPYIETEELEILEEEVKRYEPRLALDGGKDGLTFYRNIVKDSQLYLKNNGTLLFEIGYNQGEAVACLMEQAGFKQIEVEKDMSGLNRIVSGGMKDV